MNRDPDERAQPEGGPTPDEFDAIVATWRAEGHVPRWPDDEQASAPLFEARPAPVVPPPVPEEDDHFVPPEPPPLPRLGPPALVGLLLITAGLVLLVAPNWLGVPGPYGLPLGLIALAAGLGWLVLRLWPDPEGDHPSHDDGAVL